MGDLGSTSGRLPAALSLHQSTTAFFTVSELKCVCAMSVGTASPKMHCTLSRARMQQYHGLAQVSGKTSQCVDVGLGTTDTHPTVWSTVMYSSQSSPATNE